MGIWAQEKKMGLRAIRAFLVGKESEEESENKESLGFFL